MGKGGKKGRIDGLKKGTDVEEEKEREREREREPSREGKANQQELRQIYAGIDPIIILFINFLLIFINNNRLNNNR
jgi:hypothetical protein